MIERRVLYYFVKEAQEQVNKREDRKSNTKRNVGIGAALLASALGGRYLLRNRKAIPTPTTVPTKAPDIPKPSNIFDGDLSKVHADFTTRTKTEDYMNSKIQDPYRDLSIPTVISSTLDDNYRSPIRSRFMAEKSYDPSEGLPTNIDYPMGHSPRSMYLYDPDLDKTFYHKAFYGNEGTPSFRTDFRGRQIRSTFDASFPGNAEEYLAKVDEQKLEDALARLHVDEDIQDIITRSQGWNRAGEREELLRSKIDLKEIFGI